MEKYSKEWKENEQKLHGGWAQDHIDTNGDKIYKWHYIEYDTEYSTGQYYKKADCIKDNKNISQAAALLGRKGGSAKSEKKTKAVRENGKKGGRPKKRLDDSL